VHRDLMSGMRSGVPGTPTFFVNGERCDGWARSSPRSGTRPAERGRARYRAEVFSPPKRGEPGLPAFNHFEAADWASHPDFILVFVQIPDGMVWEDSHS
jgi:hypothetical protein